MPETLEPAISNPNAPGAVGGGITVNTAAQGIQGLLDSGNLIPSEGPEPQAPATAPVVEAVPVETTPEPVVEETTTQEVAEPTDASDTIDVAVEPVVEATDLPPALDAPNGWSEAAKVTFESLPSDVQNDIVRRDTERESLLSRGQRDSAESRTRADTELQSAQAERQHIHSQLVPMVEHLRELAQQGQANVEQLFHEATQTGDPDDWTSYHVAKKQTDDRAMAAQQGAQELHTARQVKLQQDIQRNALALETAIPEWRNIEVAQKELPEVKEYMTTQYQVPKEKADRVFDWTAIDTARKAMLYDRLMAKQTTKAAVAAKKVADVPPVQRPGKATTQAQVDGRSKAARTNHLRSTARNRKGTANHLAAADALKGLGIE